ncbi:hypothetical protein Q4E40_04255 [Pontibacter sp. BT731]|nr:hypothetical protein [Pontibacter sp. BT731]MDO6389327.1 hypothetical protein [Pontibacter sp. BT731]
MKHIVLTLLLFLSLHCFAKAAGWAVQNDSVTSRKVGVLPLDYYCQL